MCIKFYAMHTSYHCILKNIVNFWAEIQKDIYNLTQINRKLAARSIFQLPMVHTLSSVLQLLLFHYFSKEAKIHQLWILKLSNLFLYSWA